MTHFLIIKGTTKMVHFGTAFSNNTTRLSSRVPSKSMIRGFVGSILGISFNDIQQLKFNYGFNWLSSYKSQMIAKNRMVYTSKPTMDSILNGDRWSEGNLVNTIDYIEYLCPLDTKRLEFQLVITADDSLINSINTNIHSPKFPIFLGSAESFVKIEEINKVDLCIKNDESIFKDLFIGEVSTKSYLIKENLTDVMSEYKIPKSFEKVYTLPDKISGISKNGYIEYKHLNYSLW